jgi:hypothetical protein
VRGEESLCGQGQPVRGEEPMRRQESVRVEEPVCRQESVRGQEPMRRAGFSDEEIFEIVMVTAYYSLRCRMANGLGVDVDAHRKLDSALVEAVAYRRP